MSQPSNMQVGNSVSGADVRHIYESLSSYNQAINIGGIYLTNMCGSANPIYIYSLDILDTTSGDVKTVNNSTDIDNVFAAYSDDAEASNNGHIKKVKGKSGGIIYEGTAISMQKGTSTYKWVEISRGKI